MTSAPFSAAGRTAAPGVFTMKAVKKGSSGVLHYGLLLGQMALCAFVLLAVLSFDVADPPASAIAWPANTPPTNWCGTIGAHLAYGVLSLFGLGTWVILALWGLYLFVSAFVCRVGHPAVRALGVLLMGAGAAGVIQLAAPGIGPIPEISGGLIGASGVQLFTSVGFGTFGTFLWFALAFLVGATVAVDVWVILAPLWAFRQARAAAGPTSVVAAAAATTVVAGTARGAGWVARIVARLRKPESRAARAERLASLKGVLDAPKKGKRSRGGAAEEREEIDETAGGLGGTEAFDPDAHTVTAGGPEGDEDEEGEGEERAPAVGRGRTAGKGVKAGAGVADKTADEDDAGDAEGEDEGGGIGGSTGEPQSFDPAALREKIAKLPIVFGQSKENKRAATDADLRDIQNASDLEGYKFPGLDLLEEPEASYPERMEAFIREQATALEMALKTYGIDGEVVGMDSGPVITLYEVRLAPGTKVSQVTGLSSDIARALKAQNLRVVPNTAGKDTIGIEVPNPHKEKVRLKELMTKSELFAGMNLPMFLGKDASGNPLIADLTQMPHMLIAGTTGSGKSVCMSSILMSFLYTKKPNELKLVLVDPKMVELSQFKDIPHLMCPVVTEMGKAAAILEWAVRKMDERYELLMEAGVRDIGGYNSLTWDELKERFNPVDENEAARIPKKLPFMVFVIDELADLMMTNKEVEHSIVRIAQKARAVGIHLIVATQRPQANVVTGLIKSNMPARCAFKVASGMDSRIVMDQKGAELLLGQGDMLYLSPRSSKLTRSQGTLVDDKEIRKVVKFLKEVATPTFERSLMQIKTGASAADVLDGDDARGPDGMAGVAVAQSDPLFDKAVEHVLEAETGSVSLLQRRFAIGYTRASKLIEAMGQAGILGPHVGTQARQVMITPAEWAAMKAQAQADQEAADRGEAPLFGGPGGGPGSATVGGPGAAPSRGPIAGKAGPVPGSTRAEEETGGGIDEAFKEAADGPSGDDDAPFEADDAEDDGPAGRRTRGS
jgi:S-DNA-T family DNA segregation ATPase FtsK/SpoIIIE